MRTHTFAMAQNGIYIKDWEYIEAFICAPCIADNDNWWSKGQLMMIYIMQRSFFLVEDLVFLGFRSNVM